MIQDAVYIDLIFGSLIWVQSWIWSLSWQALLSPTDPPRYECLKKLETLKSICIFRGKLPLLSQWAFASQVQANIRHIPYFFKAIGGNQRTRLKFSTCYLQSSILLHLCLSSWSSTWWASPISKNRVKSVASLKSTETWWWFIFRPVRVIIFTLYVYIFALLPIWTFLCRSRNFPTRLIWRGLPSQSLWICHLQDDHVMSFWMAAWGTSLNSPIYCVYWCVMIGFWLDCGSFERTRIHGWNQTDCSYDDSWKIEWSP